MRYWLIANTRAGSGSRGADFWKPRLEQAGITPHEIRDLADDDWETALEAEDTVLVAGGDGSVNRAARVCLDRGATLGVLPSGTANDFSRNLHLPEDPDALCRMIAKGRVERLNAGWLDDQLFLNVVHIGLGTLPTTQASTRLKRWLGRFSYAAMLPQLRRLGLTRGFKATIHTDDERIEGRWLSLAIASGSFFGGGTQVPGASPRSGRLTLIVVRPRPWWELLWTFLITRYKGATPSDNDSVEQYATTACRIRMEHEHRVTADGELIGKFAELQSHIDKDALPVITGKR